MHSGRYESWWCRPGDGGWFISLPFSVLMDVLVLPFTAPIDVLVVMPIDAWAWIRKPAADTAVLAHLERSQALSRSGLDTAAFATLLEALMLDPGCEEATVLVRDVIRRELPNSRSVRQRDLVATVLRAYDALTVRTDPSERTSRAFCDRAAILADILRRLAPDHSRLDELGRAARAADGAAADQ